MKRILLFCALVLGQNQVSAIQQSESSAFKFNKKSVIVHFEGIQTMDDYLLEIARRGDANVIVDVTHLEDKPLNVEELPSVKQAPDQRDEQNTFVTPLYRVMADYWLLNDLNKVEFADRTFLYWPREQDQAVTLGRKLRTYAPSASLDKVLDAREQRLQRLGEILFGLPAGTELSVLLEDPVNKVRLEFTYHSLQEYLLSAQLQDYYEREQGWNGHSQGFEKNIALSELPSRLRAEILRNKRETLYRESLKRTAQIQSWGAWLTDEFWKKARIRIHTERKRPATSLLIGIPAQDKTESPNEELLSTYALTTPQISNHFSPDAIRHYRERVEQATANAAPEPEISPMKLAVLSEQQATLPISFEAKHSSLVDVLEKVQQQSPVKLLTAPTLFAPTALLTARVNRMPLSVLMRAFERLYDARWISSEGGLMLTPNARTELDRLFLRTGDVGLFVRGRAAEQNKVDWTTELLNWATEAQLRAPQGVPVSVLPKDFQHLLRANFEKKAADKLISYYAPFSPLLEEDGYLLPQQIVAGSESPTGKETLLSSWYALTLTSSTMPAPDSIIANLHFDYARLQPDLLNPQVQALIKEQEQLNLLLDETQP